ncbi:twin-arginine translocase TatA/TatE family subunit [Paenibacillus tarimensis]|uniref:twin-arginine translocase TatA/TatE family subunit n=1 Tax=Paenibacillus tarimensis TaxID=416012 RepID=UPI001F22A9DB|nr:twin-arginine translocase TatA/TatE family subunit [Paenibacillus tarimensis]MCF2943495.1 twin-arginine translocase TatA/TatE family subunit [Paenibacillus tarimensis]
MPNIGPTGFILLILVALLLFGPSKLPELGRAFGRTLREFKNGAKDIMEDDDRSDKKRVDVSRSESDDQTNNKRLPE